MTDFKAKMHQIRFRLGLRWIWGRFAAEGGAELGKRRERGRGERGKWKGGKWRAPSYC